MAQGRSSAEHLQEVSSRKVLRSVRLGGAMLQDGMQFLALLESLSMNGLSVNVVMDYHVQNIRRLRQ